MFVLTQKKGDKNQRIMNGRRAWRTTTYVPLSRREALLRGQVEDRLPARRCRGRAAVPSSAPHRPEAGLEDGCEGGVAEGASLRSLHAVWRVPLDPVHKLVLRDRARPHGRQKALDALADSRVNSLAASAAFQGMLRRLLLLLLLLVVLLLLLELLLLELLLKEKSQSIVRGGRRHRG